MIGVADTPIGDAPGTRSPDLAARYDAFLDRWNGCIYSAKAALAGGIALWVSFRMGLDHPSWALLTVYIVGDPQTGSTVSKSGARLIGTVIGGLATLVLIGLCAQERVLFLGGLGLWLGFCTFLARCIGGDAAYACVLSGFTVAAIGIPAAAAPDEAFPVVVSRVVEISVGIVCMTIISMTILPRRLEPTLIDSARQLRRKLVGFTRQITAGGAPPAAGITRQSIEGQLFTFESLVAAARFEDPQLRLRQRGLRALSGALLHVLTAAEAFASDLPPRSATSPNLPILREALADFEELLQAIPDTFQTIEQTRDLADRLLRLSSTLPDPLDAHHTASPDAISAALPEAVAVERLRELCIALSRHVSAIGAVLGDRESLDRAAPRRAINAPDILLAAIAAFRAFFAIEAGSVLWILSAWPEGGTAMGLLGIYAARFAIMANAAATIRTMTLGTLAAIPFAYAVGFLILPGFEGFPLFMASLLPFLLVCGALQTKPQFRGAALGAITIFAIALSPANRMSYDIQAFINLALAILLGTAGAQLFFTLLVPENASCSRWALRRGVGRAFAQCDGTIGAVRQFVGIMAGLIQQARLQLQETRPTDRNALNRTIAASALGVSLIRVRQLPLSTLPPLAADAATSLGVLSRRIGTGDPAALDLALRATRQGAAACLDGLTSVPPIGRLPVIEPVEAPGPHQRSRDALLAFASLETQLVRHAAIGAFAVRTIAAPAGGGVHAA